MSYSKNFLSAIISMSDSDHWSEAKKEWDVSSVILQHGNTCLCGKHPIREVITMSNRQNGNSAKVGNCCVKKFFDNDWTSSFRALGKGKINVQIIEHAFKKGYINNWEKVFALDVWRKKTLSGKQREKLVMVAQKITEKMVK